MAQLSGGPGLEWFLPGKDLRSWVLPPVLLGKFFGMRIKSETWKGKGTNAAECLHAPEPMLAFYTVVCFIPYSGPPSEVDLFSSASEG